MTTIEKVKELAQNFLNKADENHLLVSRYMDGGNEKECVEAYDEVRREEKKFIDAANELFDENWKCCLNYELAESFI